MIGTPSIFTSINRMALVETVSDFLNIKLDKLKHMFNLNIHLCTEVIKKCFSSEQNYVFKVNIKLLRQI